MTTAGTIDISGVGGVITVTDGVNATPANNWARIGHGNTSGNEDFPSAAVDPGNDIDGSVVVP